MVGRRSYCFSLSQLLTLLSPWNWHWHGRHVHGHTCGHSVDGHGSWKGVLIIGDVLELVDLLNLLNIVRDLVVALKVTEKSRHS